MKLFSKIILVFVGLKISVVSTALLARVEAWLSTLFRQIRLVMAVLLVCIGFPHILCASTYFDFRSSTGTAITTQGDGTVCVADRVNCKYVVINLGHPTSDILGVKYYQFNATNFNIMGGGCTSGALDIAVYDDAAYTSFDHQFGLAGSGASPLPASSSINFSVPATKFAQLIFGCNDGGIPPIATIDGANGTYQPRDINSITYSGLPNLCIGDTPADCGAAGAMVLYRQNFVNVTGTGNGNVRFVVNDSNGLATHAFWWQQQNGSCTPTPQDGEFAFYLGGQLSNYFYVQNCDGVWIGDGQYHWTMYDFSGNSPCGGFRGPCGTFSFGDWAANGFFILGGGGGAYLDPQGRITPALILQGDTTPPADPQGLPITISQADSLLIEDDTTGWSAGTDFHPIFTPFTLFPPSTLYHAQNSFTISRIHIGLNSDGSSNNHDGLGNVRAWIFSTSGTLIGSSINTCYGEGACGGRDLVFPPATLVPQDFILTFITDDGLQADAGWGISHIGIYAEDPHPTISSLSQLSGNGITTVSEGGTAFGSAMVFKGTLQSASNDPLALQVEVEPFGTPFINIGTMPSAAITSGQTASLSITGLNPGRYHWQARAIDLTSLVASPWQEFGNIQNVDFVLTAFRPQVLIIPGILGTKLSATSNVPWLTNSQLTSSFADDFNGDTSGIIQLFSQLEYNDNGTPVASLKTADLFNFISSPLPDSDLNCESPPQALLLLGCSPVINTYNSLRDYLLANGFVPQSFAYDWRMDLTVLSTQLYNTISEIIEQNPGAQVSLISHSMGGLIVGKMLTRIASGELSPFQTQIGPVITLGTPFDGAVDAYLKLRGWQGLLPFVINGLASAAIGKNWTAAYELLPRSDFVSVDLVTLPFASVYNGTSFASDLFTLLPRQNALPIAESFWNAGSIGQTSVFRIIGTGQHTAQAIVGHENTAINSGSTPALCKLQVVRGDGDSTVSVGSATNQRFLPTANIYYVQDTHIHLPSNTSVLSAIGNILSGQAVTLPTAPSGIQPEWSVLACSPVTLQVTDAAANVTNLHIQQIPDSTAFSLGEATQVSVPGTGQFAVDLVGTATGSFDLIFNKTDSTGQILQQATFLIVPVLKGSQAHVALDESGPRLLTLDLQGNGATGFSVSPGAQPNTATSLLVLNTMIQLFNLPHGIEVSLTTKLRNAVADLNRGDEHAALGILNAFTNEVSAQSGKALSPVDAASLVRIVNRLIGGIVNQPL